MVLVGSVVDVAASESRVRRMVQSYVVFMQTLLYGHENEMYNVRVNLKEGEELKMRELRVSWEKMGDKTKCAKG